MTKREWFAEWFDTTYYHTLYQNRNDEEATVFIENLCHFLKFPKNSKIIDLACGKGRHSFVFNKLGFHVLGLDLSSNSIEAAKKMENETLHFAVHDMRNPIQNFEPNAIFNLFTSFGYFDNLEDNFKVIQSISNSLPQNGFLIIDFMNANKVASNLVQRETKKINDITFNIERQNSGSHFFKKIEVIDKDSSFHFQEKVQYIELNDFKNLLEPFFYIENTFGDFELNSFDPITSDRLILICRKK